MPGYICLVLHAHLPYVRHPEQERFIEESWLFEAMTETYLPLIQLLERWEREQLEVRLTLTLSPTLCAMLRDRLLQERYAQRLTEMIELAKKEVHRTRWEQAFRRLAKMYLQRFSSLRQTYLDYKGDLVGAFRQFQERDRLEIITCAATHAILPLLANHSPSIRAQILVARDHYRHCFGTDPRGIWLPECAYIEGVEAALQEANIRWFTLDTNGLLCARPRPRYGVYAPVYTRCGLAAFGRDLDAAQRVWSRQKGYPGEGCYRDFYRDIGFDLDFDYVQPYLPGPEQRGFTGIKYFGITNGSTEKSVYDRAAALEMAARHAGDFLGAIKDKIQSLARGMDRPPVVVAPYDAELFGHWWYEGLEFLDGFVRAAAREAGSLALITPGDYLRRHPVLQVAAPAASSWGQDGHWQVWLNETNHWIYPHLQAAQARMTELARRFPQGDGVIRRALQLAGQELLLAQASDWPFILHTGTSPGYARQRIKNHLLRFKALGDQLTHPPIDPEWLRRMESWDGLFPDLDYHYWA